MQLKIGYLFQCPPRASPWVYVLNASNIGMTVKPCCSSLKLIYRQNLDLITIFLNYSFLIHRDNDQIGAFEFSRTFYDAIYLSLERSFGR